MDCDIAKVYFCNVWAFENEIQENTFGSKRKGKTAQGRTKS